jgi:hypothetical protein
MDVDHPEDGQMTSKDVFVHHRLSFFVWFSLKYLLPNIGIKISARTNQDGGVPRRR